MDVEGAPRVAVYIRWSTDEQGHGTTLDVQRDACMHYCLAQGWAFREDRVYVDDGYSGGTLDRPALGALRRAVLAGDVDCVVVYKLDRLSRSVTDTVDLVLKEWQGRCRVCSTREPFDTESPAGRLFLGMLMSFAEWERAVIRERTMAGKLRRALAGRNAGWRYNYGYRRGAAPGTYAIDLETAPVVRQIFRDFRGGMSLRAIARRLNEAGVLPPRAAEWSPGTVRAILTNPIYCGTVRYGVRRRRSWPAGRDDAAAASPAQVPAAVPLLVSPDEWEAVQRLRRGSPQRARPPGAGHFLLTGLASCGACGARLTGSTVRGTRYYRCSRRSRDRDACRGTLVRAAELEAAVVAAVRAAFPTPTVWHHLLEPWSAPSPPPRPGDAAAGAMCKAPQARPRRAPGAGTALQPRHPVASPAGEALPDPWACLQPQDLRAVLEQAVVRLTVRRDPPPAGRPRRLGGGAPSQSGAAVDVDLTLAVTEAP